MYTFVYMYICKYRYIYIYIYLCLCLCIYMRTSYEQLMRGNRRILHETCTGENIDRAGNLNAMYQDF